MPFVNKASRKRKDKKTHRAHKEKTLSIKLYDPVRNTIVNDLRSDHFEFQKNA